MTRFARAKGSKACGHRLPEEATMWASMKNQRESTSHLKRKREQLDETTEMIVGLKSKRSKKKETNGKEVFNKQDSSNFRGMIKSAKTNSTILKMNKQRTEESLSEIKSKSLDKKKEIILVPGSNNDKCISEMANSEDKIGKHKCRKGENAQIDIKIKGEIAYPMNNQIFGQGVSNFRGNIKRQSLEKMEFDFEKMVGVTCFDGYWVKTVSLDTIEILKKKFVAKGYDEERLRRALKKVKRGEHRKLRLECIDKALSRKIAKQPGKPGKNSGIIFCQNNNMTKFEGFWVKPEAADQLRNLKMKLETKGLPASEIKKIILKERRKDERDLKKDRKQVCLKCRQPGHLVRDCPNLTENYGSGICYRCGSTEHKMSNCRAKTPIGKSGSLPFANCYVCGEQGHISRECPDNPRGLYPHGGACNMCGAVTHLKKDCPEWQSQQEGDQVTISRFNTFSSVDAENDDGITEKKKRASKKRNIIKFT